MKQKLTVYNPGENIWRNFSSVLVLLFQGIDFLNGNSPRRDNYRNSQRFQRKQKTVKVKMSVVQLCPIAFLLVLLKWLNSFARSSANLTQIYCIL